MELSDPQTLKKLRVRRARGGMPVFSQKQGLGRIKGKHCRRGRVRIFGNLKIKWGGGLKLQFLHVFPIFSHPVCRKFILHVDNHNSGWMFSC